MKSNDKELETESRDATVVADNTDGRWKRRSILAAKMTVAVSLVSWLMSTGRLQTDRILNLSLSVDVILLLALILVSLFLPAVRWWWLLEIQGIKEPLLRITSHTWVGYFTGLILPGSVSGDVARTVLVLRGRRSEWTRVLSTILADRFLGIYTLFVVGCVTALVMSVAGGLDESLTSLIAAECFLLLTLTLGGIGLLFPASRVLLLKTVPTRWRIACDDSLQQYLDHRSAIVGCIILSILSNVAGLAAFSVAGRLLGEAVSLSESLLAGPMVILANCIPLTPGGIGVAEAVSSRLFDNFQRATGAEMMMLVRTSIMLIACFGMVAIFLIRAVGSGFQTANLTPLLPSTNRTTSGDG